MKVLQAPLGFDDTPKSKELSEGRFIIYHKGFLDPEVYSKDRRITIAGRIAGSGMENIDNYAHRYLKIESREIYLWSDQEPYYPAPYHYYRPWYYPYPYFRHHPHPYSYWW